MSEPTENSPLGDQPAAPDARPPATAGAEASAPGPNPPGPAPLRDGQKREPAGPDDSAATPQPPPLQPTDPDARGETLSATERGERFYALQERLRELRNQPLPDPAEQAQLLADAERQFVALGRSSGQSRERQLELLLGNLQDWHRRCQDQGLEEEATHSAELIEGLLEDVGTTWQGTVDQAIQANDRGGCFQTLLRTSSLYLEIQRRSVTADRDHAQFLETRRTLQTELLRMLAESPLTAEERKLWTSSLLDYADLTLTSIDDLPPQLAGHQLSVVAEDLAWYLQHVERKWNGARRSLRRKWKRIRAEQQERALQARLEARFGTRLVSWSERTVLGLIVLVVLLMTVEWVTPLDPMTLFYFNLIDALACTVFLTEFTVKLILVKGKLNWFRRHFLIDLVPSIPIGLLAAGLSATSAADPLRAGRLARFLRLPRLARYLRVLRPLVRLIRALGLSLRGFDRLIRNYGKILNRNVILYPTREELELYEGSQSQWEPQSNLARMELQRQWARLLESAGSQASAVARCRRGVLDTTVTEVVRRGLAVAQSAQGNQNRDIPARTLLEQLKATTPQAVEANLRVDLVAQLARVIRVFSPPPLRWLPIISSWIPRVRSDMSDAEIVAVTARRVSGWLKYYYDLWFFAADLYGTVTPSQFVDRVGQMLVKSSFRPAYRLALFGGILLLVELVLRFARFELLQALGEFLQKYVGTTVLVLGSICFLILGLGWWLQRLAKETTEFYERAANANFLSLTEMIRSRHLQRDADILYDRVLRAEWNRAEGNRAAGNRAAALAPAVPASPAVPSSAASSSAASSSEKPDPYDRGAIRSGRREFLDQRIRQLLLGTHREHDADSFGPMEQVLLIYRDWLDGGLLTSGDTRTVSQLLANPSISQLTERSDRVDRRRTKSLNVLDLERQKSLFGGPYIWFNFVSRSISHSVAYLLVDYNRNAIPLEELQRVGPEERRRYQRWLTQAAPQPDQSDPQEAKLEYVTSTFTALHFLDFEPGRDREIERRFGTQVRERMVRDRSRLIRKIFGTYPMHDLPKEKRQVNPITIYQQYFAGGKVILLPLALAWLVLQFVGKMIVWLANAVQEIRNPERRSADHAEDANADFRTAVRKIGRIRDPIVYASLELRMLIDPEYLGVRFPRAKRSALRGADVDADLRFLRPEPSFMELVDLERKRAQADMRRLEQLIDSGVMRRAAECVELAADAFESPDHYRAAAVAYLADLNGIRTHLSALALMREVFAAASTEPLWSERLSPRQLLRRKFLAYWRSYGDPQDRQQRRFAWTATLHNHHGVRTALEAWYRLRDDVAQVGQQRLAEILLHPGRINEQLMTVRTIQTFAILDVLNYREHIYQLGRYEEAGESVRQLLTWDTAPTADAPPGTSDSRD